MPQYEPLLKREEIVKVEPNPEGAVSILCAAKRHLSAALKLISKAGGEEEMPEEAYARAYMAGVTAFRALMAFNGYEISEKVRDRHVTTLNFGRLALGSEGEKWVNAVRNMRIKRHNIEYGTQEVEVSPTVARARIESVQKLIALVEERTTGQVSMDL